MKLISMTDFVLEQRLTSEEISAASFQKIQNHIANYYDKVFAYANFLKQPLELKMFFPCDEKESVLSEPSPNNYNWGYLDELIIYNKAKEKVLFKDFQFVKSDIETLNHTTFIENSKGEQVGYNKSWEEIWNLHGVIIEDLIGFEIELTDSALKQIGLTLK